MHLGKGQYVHPYLVKQHVHVMCVCIRVWGGTEQGLFFFFPLSFSLYFLQARVGCQACLQSSASGSWHFAAHATDSLMFLKLTKLLRASLSLSVPYTLTSSSWPDPGTTENQRGESGHRQVETQLITWALCLEHTWQYFGEICCNRIYSGSLIIAFLSFFLAS